MYVKGYHNVARDKGVGAKHIKLHLQENSYGYITLEELLNLGKSIREYIKNFKEPFVDKNQAKIYEWENKQGVRFRVITDKIKREGNNFHSTSSDKVKREGHSNTPLSPFDDVIITFYSDRNLNKKMEFKNPLVNAYYQNQSKLQSIQKTLSSKASIAEKDKALRDLDSLGKKALTKDQKQVIQELQSKFENKEILKRS